MDTINAHHVWRFLMWICLIGQQISVNSKIPESPVFRLVGGTSKYNGHVEVFLRGKWGTVCDDYFGTSEAKVLCKTLGFPYHTAMAVSSNRYGQGQDPIWLDDIVCQGNESSIINCNSLTIGQHNCHHFEDIGVVCTREKHVYRLINGNSDRDGHVQVNTGNGWVAVSGDNFNAHEATVLCYYLNLPYHAVQTTSYTENGSVWIENMNCMGNEPSLYDCQENRRENHRWSSGNKAGVVCAGGCIVPTKPRHGDVLYTGTNTDDVATYFCDTGYTLNGSNLSVCSPKDHWNPGAPNCSPKDCGNLSSARHASSTINQSEVTYSCMPGYFIQVSNIIKCIDTGRRSDTQPVCMPLGCEMPDLPRNGYVTANSTVYGSVAFYYCNDGYVQQGSKISTCLSSGDWDKEPPSCVPVAELNAKFCSEDIDERGTAWDATVSGTSVVIPCSSVNQDSVGNVSRYCTIAGSWSLPEYDCLRHEFKQLEQTIQTVLTNVSAPAIDDALSSLSSITQVTDSHDQLYSGEISKAADMLDIIANVSSGITISEEQSQSFVQTVGNLLDTKNQGAWDSVTQASDKPSQQNKKAEKASKVLKAVGKYTDAIAKTLAETNETERIVPNKNMVLLVANIDKPKDIQFPDISVTRNSNFSYPSASFQLDKESVKGATSYSGVLYKNLGHILPSTTVKMSNSTSTVTRDINSAVLAVQLHSNLTHHLPSPIVLQFSHLEARYKDASCVFWNEQRLGWDNNGCRRNSSNVTTTVCVCDHLTNFAILMSPWTEESVSTLAIDVLSYVGCSISVACLLITVVLHLIHWRYLKPHFRTVVLMHLSVALVFSYTLFLFGADKTEHRDICTAMASLLHYIYLTVFFIMLAECIDVAWIVLLPLQQSSRPKWTLSAAWALPAVIVGVALGVTKLRGYGTDSYCWLSTDNGLIWAFIGPALLVILSNLIVIILVLKVLCQTKAMKEKDVLARVRSSLWCLLILLPLTGCTWIIGIFYINENTEWIQYMFVICNTLQGFAIFLCHCVFNKKMVEAIRQRHKRSRSTTFHSESTSKSSRFHMPSRFKFGRKTYTVTITSSTDTRF